MDQIEIKGKVNTAICYARVVEEEAIEQIRRMCDYPMMKARGSASCRMCMREKDVRSEQR